MNNIKITENIKYIGVNDKEIDLFESQYDVPNGVAYNSYVIMDEKITVMDTVDSCKVDEWLVNLEEELNGATPTYLVCLHMEPDHAGSARTLIEKYPDMKIVGNVKTFVMIEQFFGVDLGDRKVVVKEGETLPLAASYDGGAFACMEDFLHHLKSKNYQKRTIGLVENGSWAPSAIRSMKGIIEGMKAITFCENSVTVKSVLKEDSLVAMEQLAEELIK